MRRVAVLVALVSIACSGGAASTPAPQPDEPRVDPPAPRPPAPVRVELGQCTTASKVAFVSGKRLAIYQQGGAFAALTGTAGGSKAPSVAIGGHTASPGLDKNIIRRYIRRQLPRIKLCYERELSLKPALQGTVRATFTIDPSGNVSRSTAAGLAAVDACVAAVIGKMQFPKPIGGGAVNVSYPFHFRPATASSSAPRNGVGGTIGIGRGGGGSGSGYGSGAGHKPQQPTQVRFGSSTVVGPLDKNIIRRYIRRKIRAIQVCYERELLRQPNLAGTVVAQFTIEPTGKVSGAAASGMNKAVDSCVARLIAGIQFPKPRGGGAVKVRYPFVFRSTGSTGTATRPAPGPTAGPTSARETAIERARQVGILGALGGGIEVVDSPLAPARDAIEACAREHLDISRRHDALIADVGGDNTGVRSAGSHRDLEQCVADAVAAIKPDKPLRCPIAVGTMDAGVLPRIELGGRWIKFGGRPLGDLDDGGDEQLKRALGEYRDSIVAPGFTPEVATIGPVALVAGDRVAMERVIKVIAIAAAAGVAVEVARGSGKLVRADPLPWVPVPTRAIAARRSFAMVRVKPDSVEVRTDGAPIDVAVDALTGELESRANRGEPQHLIVSADGAVPYERMVAVLAALEAGGLTDWEIR